MRKNKIVDLKLIIRDEIKNQLYNEGFFDLFRRKPKQVDNPNTNSTETSDQQTPQSPQPTQTQADATEADKKQGRLYKIFSGLMDAYLRGYRQNQITSTRHFKELLNSGTFKVKSEYDLYRLIADTSGEPDQEDPFYKFADLKAKKPSKTAETKPRDFDINTSATNRGKEILNHAKHFMTSFDNIDNQLKPRQTESLRRIIRKIIKDL